MTGNILVLIGLCDRFTEDHEAAAVEIQKIGRSKRDRKRVKAIREQKEQERQLRELTEEVCYRVCVHPSRLGNTVGRRHEAVYVT